MAMLPLKLPTIQNWSCHNCSGCCKEHLITITEEERQRILKQNWKPKDGIPADQPVVQRHGGLIGKKRYRLAHRSDGSCVFLNENGLCRIHAKHGEDAKPLACRIYPYAFHPSGSRITVSLRFSCPSVVSNLGDAVSEKRDELKRIQQLVVPENADRTPPPKITPREKLDWPDFLKIVSALERIISHSEGRIIERLYQALLVTDLIDQSQFGVIQGERLAEFLEIIAGAATQEEIPEPDEPGSLARTQFRLLVANYARKDTIADLNAGLSDRWRLLRAATRFAGGRGNAAPLQNCFREVPFDTIEQPFGGLPAEAEEVLTRYLQVKLQGLHFCGAAYYDVPLVEGFRSLALIVPSICWIARWLAASDSRHKLARSDIETAITIADHHHGYSQIFGSRGFRRRVRMLAGTGDITRLLLWYAR